MDNGMWALGLLLFPLIGYAIVIFLIIKFISFVINKTKKDQPNNFIIDNNIQKQDTINLKEKTKLYKLFIIFSILTCIFLLPFVNSMTSKFPSAYPGNEASSGVITSEIANQIAVYVWTILIAYLIMLVTLIIRKTNYRKVYYPLSLFTLTIIFLNIGIIYCGHMIMWYLIVFLWPLIILLIFLAIIGNKLDNNTIKKKTVVIILISVLSILSIISMLPFISLKDKNIKRGYDADKTVETDQNNEEEKQKNKIKKEFNNLIDNNFFSINDFKLNEDYNTIDNIELLIIDDNISNNEVDFCNDLIETYNNVKVLLNKYNYTSQTIHFEFINRNPFAKEESTFYKKSGYIRDCGASYLVYLNPTPIEINK